jgi:hypothetical protein
MTTISASTISTSTLLSLSGRIGDLNHRKNCEATNVIAS